MGNRKRFEVKLTDRQLERLRLTAEALNMNSSQCLRNALYFGLAALIKFETGNKLLWKEIQTKAEKNLDNSTKSPGLELTEENIAQRTPEEEQELQEQIKIANTKWLTEEEDE